MRIYKVGLPFIGMSSLMLLMSPLANAAEMPSMDHSGMD
ncbi:MAG TPA: copper resistance protein B, partial [Psychrobacter sp.]|nr:copper resistance protein B [Psychrobacter sp.]